MAKLLFTDRLRKMQGQVAKAMETYTPGGVVVPDGVYDAKLTCELREAKESGNLMVSRTFTIAEGEQAGLNVWDNLVIENNDTGVQICRRWVETHGYQWPDEDFAQIEYIVQEINEVAPMVRVRVKTTVSKTDGGEYTNCTVQKLLDGSETEAPAAVEEAPAEAPAEEAPAAASSEVTADELDDMTREQLKALIKADTDMMLAVRVTIKMTDDDIRTAIREFRAAQGSEAPAAEESGLDKTVLLTFCASQNVAEATEEMEVEQVVEAMSGYAFLRNELTEEEIAMLDAAGLSANIRDPEPAKPAPKAPAKPAAKPAAPAARPAAKPATPAKPAMPAKPAQKPAAVKAPAKPMRK